VAFENTYSVSLSKSEHFCLIDKADLVFVGQHKWYLAKAKKGLYYARMTSRKKLYLHRLIVGACKGDIVDHINGDTLDCRRENLRFVSAHPEGWWVNLDSLLLKDLIKFLDGLTVDVLGFTSAVEAHKLKERLRKL